MLVGAHVSASGGVYKAPHNAVDCNCECFQIFTKSQLQWAAKPLDAATISDWHEAWQGSGWLPCFIHNSYLINLCSPDEAHRKKSVAGMIDEIERASLLSIKWVNTHPGSHKGAGEQAGLDNCVKSLKEILEATKNLEAGILLETTAGQGNDLGSRFEHIGYLLKKTGYEERMGVCYDTCHGFAAGYDIREAKSYEKTWKEFDEKIGIERLRAFHLNDSKFELGKHKDRHAEIGKGFIGEEGFKMLMQDERFKGLMGVCELPDEGGETERSIGLLLKLRGKSAA